MKKRLLILLVTVLAFLGSANSQNVALKTNIIPDALLTPNLGLEVGLAKKWTLDISGQLNLWNINGQRWRHWLVQPEARYWFCDRFAGHFLGFHLLGGQYNIGHINNDVKIFGLDFSKLGERRYQGWGAGAGIAYGYAWILGEHWNLEAEIGLGYAFMRYDVIEMKDCCRKIAENVNRNYFGPTKAAINFVYIF